MLRAVGIRAALKTPEWPTLWTDVQKGRVPFYYMGRGLMISGGPAISQYFETDGSPRIGYSNPAVDDLLRQSRGAFDKDSYVKTINRALSLVLDDAPAHFPVAAQHPLRRFQGHQVHAAARSPGFRHGGPDEQQIAEQPCSIGRRCARDRTRVLAARYLPTTLTQPELQKWRPHQPSMPTSLSSHGNNDHRHPCCVQGRHADRAATGADVSRPDRRLRQEGPGDQFIISLNPEPWKKPIGSMPRSRRQASSGRCTASLSS